MIDEIEPNTMVFVLNCTPDGGVALSHKSDLSEMDEELRVFFNALSYGITLALMTKIDWFLDIAEIAGASEALKEIAQDQKIEGQVQNLDGHIIPFKRGEQ